jgi:hypothetical protein
MLTFKNFLKESTKLTPAELIKPNSQTGVIRLEILKSEIVNSNPLELAKGGTVVVIDIDSALSAIKQFEKDNKPFKLNTNRGPIRSSDLAKNKIFGGGIGGAGSGTEATATNESAQCVWLQAMLDAGSNNPIEYFNDNILTAAYKKVSVDVSLDKILDISDQWKRSSYQSAKILIDNGYAKKGMVCHRGSKLMKDIYTAKNLAAKNSGLSKITDDKWNPGDIWLAAASFKISHLPTDSLSALNEKIKDLFSQRILVAISLKLVGKKPKLTEYNTEDPPSISTYKFINFHLESNRGSFWSSKAGAIEFNGGVMQVKTNTAFGSLKAELAGKKARGGGIGWGGIEDYAKSELRKTLAKNGDMKKMAQAISKGNKKDIDSFWKMVSYLYPSMKYEEFIEELKSKDAIWIHSKLGVSTLAYAIKSVGGAAADSFITKIVNYASSAMEESSTYVKVSE